MSLLDSKAEMPSGLIKETKIIIDLKGISPSSYLAGGGTGQCEVAQHASPRYQVLSYINLIMQIMQRLKHYFYHIWRFSEC